VLSPKDYLTARLTGIVATDALSSRALVDSSGADYASELVALVDGLGERLPGLRSPTEDLGPVAPNDLGLPISARTVVGTMDAWGDIFGNGAIRSGDGFIVGGTSEIVGCVSDRRVPTDGVISFPGSDDGLIVHAGPTQAGGDAARWWAEARGATVAQLVAEAEKAPAGSGGVVFLPHLLGERAPLWDSEARGAFLGLSTSTSPAELSRAVLEGVAFSVRELFEAAEHAAGRSAERITMSGGTARSELWCQITADVLGRPLRRPTVTDTAVLGAALLGGVGTRRFPSMAAAIERAVHVERVFHPDARNVRHYSALFEIYRESYQALRAVHSGFAALRSQARTQD
jgi:xylulokinase